MSGVLNGKPELLIVADHASAFVPDDIDLGIDPRLLDLHIAVDIGVAQVAQFLAKDLHSPLILGNISRLVIDLNREPEAAGLIPLSSDGNSIPGNLNADQDARIARFHTPYHARIAQTLAGMAKPFILSIHSFTPSLTERPEERRPWDIGILYNMDDRAARIAIPALEQAGLIVGDQLPYSGKVLNATMNRHAEAAGIPYLGVEIRQDRISDEAGQRRFASLLAPVVRLCRDALAPERPV